MGRDIGVGWAITIMHEAFAELALDFVAIDREAAFTSLSRIELLIADQLAAFREFYPERHSAEIIDTSLAAVLEEMGLFVENTRDAVKRGRAKPE